MKYKYLCSRCPKKYNTLFWFERHLSNHTSWFNWRNIMTDIILFLICTIPFYIYSPHLDFLKVSSTAPEKEKLILSPEIKHVTCGGGINLEYPFKITNNHEYAIFDGIVYMEFNGTSIDCDGITISDELKRKTIDVGGALIAVENTPETSCVNGKLSSLSFQGLNINPYETLSYWITLNTKNCEGEHDIVAKIYSYSKDSNSIWSVPS